MTVHTASLALALVAGILFSAGVYLLLQRALTRVIIGLALMAHAGNVVFLVAGGASGEPAFITKKGAVPANVVDPLPQAFALTAIVISFAVTALLLALAYRSFVLTHDDTVADDVEDRRIARLAEADPE